MAANSMLLRLKESEHDHKANVSARKEADVITTLVESDESKVTKHEEKESKSITWNKQRTRELNTSAQDKSGWLKKRSRHLKKWRQRFAQIEQQQYLCTYNDDTLKHCTEKIDMTQATIYYTIDKPIEFQIYPKKKNTEFYFECVSISEANDWLINLKKINETFTETINSKKKNNDLDLITDAAAWILSHNMAHVQSGKEPKVSDIEVNQLYMKALNLYQHAFYQECQQVIKSVLTLQPKHRQATKLSEYLIQKLYTGKSDKEKKRGSRRRFATVSVTKSSTNRTKSPALMQRFSVWKNNSNKDVASIAAKMTVEEMKEENINMDQYIQIQIQPQIHACQIEFRRFITERIQLNKYYDDLLERFEMAKYDDIRFLNDFDKDTLGDEIGLRPLHIKCFLRKRDVFMNEMKLFHGWLKQIVMQQKQANQFNNVTSERLIDLFENHGITTFEALYRYIQRKEDLERIIIGDDALKVNNVVYDVLWNSMNVMERKQRARLHSVAETYGEIDEAILGINEEVDVNQEGVIEGNEETAHIAH